jgi:hypothetical protein
LERRSVRSEALPPQAARLQLPSSPDLNWLHNRAKERLRELRVADPTAKLADAQLLVARDYGFASWRKLGAHGPSWPHCCSSAAQTSLPPGDQT